MKSKEYKKICLFIKENFIAARMSLRDYISDSIDEIYDVLDGQYEIDVLQENLLDDPYYGKFLKQMVGVIENDKKTIFACRINIVQDICDEYIELTEYGRGVTNGNKQWMVDRLNEFDQYENKGIKYEKFCSYFLKDLGFVTRVTKASNDDGIDVLAILISTFKNSIITNIFFGGQINILAQAKYYANPVDTPVIRNLIGDSLFYRFSAVTQNIENRIMVLGNNPTILCVFSHMGFTRKARQFAENNGIVLFSSEMIADILVSLNEWEDMYAVRFLKGLLD